MKKIVIILGGLILIGAIMIMTIVEYWQPDGVFEGQWEGTFVSMDGDVKNVLLEVDEQSNRYGHIGIYFEELEVFLPMHYEKNRLWLDQSAGSGTFDLVETDGIYQLVGIIDASDTSQVEGKYDLYKVYD